MFEKSVGSGGERTTHERPSACDTNSRDLEDLLRELDRPLDQSVVDRGLLRLATFVAGRH
ncbi:hypothetical protein GGQ98_003265 [Sphingosinicella soli]|uniref:Uncharacterized protein n=2 Tax=Sphingosinicella soli TaxID=333708 RepID=A0A7W7F8E3_9SPHN|nr:hypothetical protein [Sphingosinicella soli]